MALADGSLWIAVQAAGAAHRGGTLRLVADAESDRLHRSGALATRPGSSCSVVYDGLVGFKRVGGTDGNTLVPDLASALPAPTDNGRTYTFRLREGIRFADGRELKASAVRSSFERLFRAKPRRPDFYEGIVGGPACMKQPKRCDLSKGVVTDDDTGIVTIRLRAPDPEFLYKLALPFASDRPDRHTRDRRPPGARHRPVPDRGATARSGASGSSAIATSRMWSKAAQPEGVPDEIVLELGGTADAQLTAVQRGRADALCPHSELSAGPARRRRAPGTRLSSTSRPHPRPSISC